MLADEYLEDLVAEQVTERQFNEAALLVRRRCTFFPKMSQIMEAVQEVRSRPISDASSDSLRIEEHTETPDNLTPEEIARNKERIAEITRMLCGEISIEQAVENVSSMGHIREFGSGSGNSSKL